MSDELSAPLGRKRQGTKLRSIWRNRRWPIARMIFGVLALLGAGAIGWIIAVEDPTGGLPQAEATIGAPEPNRLAQELETAPAPRQEPEGTTALPTLPQTAQADGDGSGPAIITLGPEAPVSTQDAPLLSQAERAVVEFGAQPGLVEDTQYGMIPRVSADGTRPFDAYARPSLSPASAEGRPLISIVVTGLALNQAVTESAIYDLPGAVTLAFAPYGNALPTLANQAREAGHELLLEVPLEPFDYPQSDPGPHTLLVEQPPRDNLEKLYWLLARFGGYTGIVNNQGARFTASTADFNPIMEELGLRGLGYLDDGNSNRSLAPQLAREHAVPFLRAQGALDDNPSREAVRSQLDAVLAHAQERGSAVATLSALPVSIAVLEQWARDLEDERAVLVPFSALAGTQGQQQQDAGQW